MSEKLNVRIMATSRVRYDKTVQMTQEDLDRMTQQVQEYSCLEPDQLWLDPFNDIDDEEIDNFDVEIEVQGEDGKWESAFAE